MRQPPMNGAAGQWYPQQGSGYGPPQMNGAADQWFGQQGGNYPISPNTPRWGPPAAGNLPPWGPPGSSQGGFIPPSWRR
ncbi:hypothetical protein ACOME3_008111 [Neoechinorhynchus agilis]